MMGPNQTRRPTAALVVAGSYVLGALPLTNVVARWRRGVDLREVGTGTVSGSGLYAVAGFAPRAAHHQADQSAWLQHAELIPLELALLDDQVEPPHTVPQLVAIVTGALRHGLNGADDPLGGSGDSSNLTRALRVASRGRSYPQFDTSETIKPVRDRRYP